MRAPIIRSIAIIALVVTASAVGYTSSYFNDTETSADNVFQAGSLDLIIGEPVDAAWVADDLLPGDEVEGELDLENAGSLPFQKLLLEVEVDAL